MPTIFNNWTGVAYYNGQAVVRHASTDLGVVVPGNSSRQLSKDRNKHRTWKTTGGSGEVKTWSGVAKMFVEMGYILTLARK